MNLMNGRGLSGDFLACGVDPSEEPWFREAYQLTCGPLSR